MGELFFFLEYAFAGAILIGIGTGLVGPFVHVNRLGFLTGSIAHAILCGIGLAVYFQSSILTGALLAAPVLATIVGLVDLKISRNSETIIGAVWAMGMAIGVIAIYLTPGYGIDYSALLFGNILLISEHHVIVLFVLNVIISVILYAFYPQLCALSFDRDFSAIRGINVTFFYLLLINVVAVTTVLAVHGVGLILVIALMLLPSAIARCVTRTFRALIFASILISTLLNIVGLLVSYYVDIPTGPTIILVLGLTYIVSIITTQIRGNRIN